MEDHKDEAQAGKYAFAQDYYNILQTLQNHSSNACCIGFDVNAEQLFVGTEGGSVYAWDLSSQQPKILRGHKTKITGIVYEEHTNIIATSSADATVKIWDIRANTN